MFERFSLEPQYMNKNLGVKSKKGNLQSDPPLDVLP